MGWLVHESYYAGVAFMVSLLPSLADSSAGTTLPRFWHQQNAFILAVSELFGANPAGSR